MGPDQAIAHYRITAKLGEGGMGEVWRATDTKLNREVAIKVLPENFAADPDRLARFTREAQVLASLNHPNIAAIYGVEERALVMELVPGPTLAERIEAGTFPVEEALPMVQQLIDALEYAHERGVVHRDLKPANIKLTAEGRIKVLDFGLAKAITGDTAAGDPMSSPTLTMRATIMGAIMGTAAYMAPEQARGHDVDKRADIWAFGVVVYEMLTGLRLFEGPTVSDTLAAVLRQQPQLDRVPEPFRKLVRACLERDPRSRLRDIGDARLLLKETPAAAPPPAAAPRRGMPAWALAIPALAALALGGVLWRETRPVLRPMMRFSADLGPDAIVGNQITAAISPDGTRLVFLERGPGGTHHLATRLLDQAKVDVLAGTENAEQPFFRPDGQWIGFFADQKLKKISVLGGAAVTLCETTVVPRGASWGDDGNIVANLDNLHLFRVPEGGGQPQPLSRPEDHGEFTWRFPQVLPGSQRILFMGAVASLLGSGFETANIEVLNLQTGQLKIVQRGGYFGRYLPSGHLTFIHQGTLFAVPFDLDRLEARGTPRPVVEEVAAAVGQGAGQLDFSQTGTLIYLSGKSTSTSRPTAWMDSRGNMEPLLTTGAAVLTPRLSPDGRLLAYASGNDIAIYDPKRSATTRLTFTGSIYRFPVWMPDGKHIVYSTSASENALRWIRSDGSSQPEKLFSAKEGLAPSTVSPDGRRLLFTRDTTPLEIWMLPLDLSDPDHPKPGNAELFLHEDNGVGDPSISPDGRWLAYTSFGGGGAQVFVRPFHPGAAGGKWQVSNAGGRFPVWSRGTKQILYLNQENRIMAARYSVAGESFAAEKPEQWSPAAIIRTGNNWNFDVAPDGKRVVAFPQSQPEAGEKGSVHVTVLLNFFDELKRRMP